MDREQVERRKAEVVERVGPWLCHNICLGNDVYTREPRVIGDEVRAKRILQVVSDISGRPLDALRVLDLGCMEGLFAIELAHHGAKTVAIEGRRTNVERASFARDELGLGNLDIVQDDVRNLSREKYGEFDVVLCLGILYHLDAPDVFRFMEKVSEVCRSFAIIDTHVGMSARARHDYKGVSYGGRNFVEHRKHATAAQREELLKASLDNPTSFWLTRPSLYNLLANVGFTSVFECHNPAFPIDPEDRAVFVAMKGQRRTLKTVPLTNTLPEASWPEGPKKPVSSGQRWYYRAMFLYSELIRALPAPFKRAARAVVRRGQ